MGLIRLLFGLFAPRRTRLTPRNFPYRQTARESSALDLCRPSLAGARPPAPRPPVTALTCGTVLSGSCWVIDGDTIVMCGHNIRLAGIDAPELDQPWGKKARSALIELCRGRTVRAEVVGELSYDRQVAVCRLEDGRHLAAEMVRMGLALDWRKYSGGRYRNLEPADARKRLWRADARQKGRFPPTTI
jgi:micrococcal nuclease